MLHILFPKISLTSQVSTLINIPFSLLNQDKLNHFSNRSEAVIITRINIIVRQSKVDSMSETQNQENQAKPSPKPLKILSIATLVLQRV